MKLNVELDGPLDFSMVQNNNCAIDVYIRRKNTKVAFDLTSCRVLWQLFENGKPVASKDSNAGAGEIQIFDQTQPATLGKLRLFLVPGDTVALQPDKFRFHEFVIIDTNGKVLNVAEDDPLLTAGTAFLRRQLTVQP